jgi:pimeloyl-ACP methyl ester carboxylesterase
MVETGGLGEATGDGIPGRPDRHESAQDADSASAADSSPGAPPLPPGRFVDLPGRGTTFVRELAGPPDAPTVVLLHGWTATADLTWYQTYEPVAAHYRVLALDHRGHGRGIRSRRPFRLEDCADDVAALAGVLGIDRLVPVGYSMGGPVAMLLWRRHPAVVDGLVLCATARSFSSSRQDRAEFLALAGLAMASRLTPEPARAWIGGQVITRRGRRTGEWARAEVMRNDWRHVLEAGAAIGTFSARSWVGEIDVPTAVVVTTDDRVVPLPRQERLVASVPDAVEFRVEGDHDVCVAHPERFLPALVAACDHVSSRSDAREVS